MMYGNVVKLAINEQCVLNRRMIVLNHTMLSSLVNRSTLNNVSHNVSRHYFLVHNVRI